MPESAVNRTDQPPMRFEDNAEVSVEASQRDARRPPVWQIDQCPAWCLGDHRDDELPADRMHYSREYRIRLPLEPAAQVLSSEGERWEMDYLTTYVEQHPEWAAPVVLLGRGEAAGARLRLDDVGALATMLEGMERIGRAEEEASPPAESEEEGATPDGGPGGAPARPHRGARPHRQWAGTCPSWCDNGTPEHPCRGEHIRHSSTDPIRPHR